MKNSPLGSVLGDWPGKEDYCLEPLGPLPTRETPFPQHWGEVCVTGGNCEAMRSFRACRSRMI